MKILQSIPYVLVFALFTVLTVINLMAINSLLSNLLAVIAVGGLLVLECLLVVWYYYQCQLRKADCTHKIKLAVKWFYGVFLVMSIGSVAVFATQELAPQEALLIKGLKAGFWLWFMGFSSVGVGLMITFLSGQSKSPKLQVDAKSRYGNLGYQHSN